MHEFIWLSDIELTDDESQDDDSNNGCDYHHLENEGLKI